MDDLGNGGSESSDSIRYDISTSDFLFLFCIELEVLGCGVFLNLLPREYLAICLSFGEVSESLSSSEVHQNLSGTLVVQDAVIILSSFR